MKTRLGFSLMISIIILMMFFLCGCDRATVTEEIYRGQEKFSPDEAERYLQELVGGDAEKYEFTRTEYGESIRCDIIDDTNCKGGLSNQVSITGSDEAKIQLPCNLDDITSYGWAPDEKNTSLSQINYTYYKNKNGGRISLFGEDSSVLGLSVNIGDFSGSKKENYALIYDNQPEFDYMGITRKSTPADVIKILGLPNEIYYRYCAWLEFEYSWFDENGLCNSLKFEWWTSADEPEIMSEFKMRGGLTFFADLLN